MIGRGVAYHKTGLHEILFISTVDLLQPPRAPVHPASTARYSTGYCSTSPVHGLLFNHPSTGYCSSSPPPTTVQPAVHGSRSSSLPRGPVHPPARSIRVLFIQRQRPLLPRGPVHPTPIGNCSSKPPQQRSLFIQREHRWLQLAAGAKESLDRVQLTAIDRSLGFSNK